MPTLIACRHSPTYRKAGLKPPLQPPNGGTPTAKIHSFSLSGKFFRLKSAPCKGNGRSPLPYCHKVGQKTQRAAQAIAAHCTRHRSALHRPSHRTAPDGAKRKAGLHCGIRPGCECYARGCLPHILGLAGIVIHLLGAPFHIVHIELLLVGVQHALEAHIVCLVGVKGLPHDDVAAAAGVVACRE